jgi:hypothetical protein
MLGGLTSRHGVGVGSASVIIERLGRDGRIAKGRVDDGVTVGPVK